MSIKFTRDNARAIFSINSHPDAIIHFVNFDSIFGAEDDAPVHQLGDNYFQRKLKIILA